MQNSSASPAVPTQEAQSAISTSGHVVDFGCDPCIDRTSYTLRAIVHGTSGDGFWMQIRRAALQSARDMQVEVEFDLHATYDADRMAQEILAAAAPGADRPDALIVTVPGPVVADAVRRAAPSIPIFGMNSGYDLAQTAGILGFFAMDEYVGGKEAANEFRNQRGSGSIARALFVNHEKGNSALDARFRGLSDTLGQQETATKNTSTVVEEVAIDPFGTEEAPMALTILEDALEGCSYDAILLAGAASLSLTEEAYYSNSCDFSRMLLGTFDTSRDVFDAIAEGKVAFAISQQQFLQGALPVVIAAVFATTGSSIAKSFESESGFYLTGPNILNLRNLPSDTQQDCENEAFPVCQHDSVRATGSGRCPCTERSKIRIGGVLHGETTDSFWDIVFAQIHQSAYDLGIDLKIDRLEPQPTSEILHNKMSEKIKSLCREGVDGLFVTIPSDIVIPAIRLCKSLNIPVISINSGATFAKEEELVHHISQLEDPAGHAAGEAMIQAGMREGLCVVLDAGNIAETERCKGFEDAIIESPKNITFLGMLEVNKDKDTSYRVAIEEKVGRSGDWDGVGILNIGGMTVDNIVALKADHLNVVAGTFDVNENAYDGIEKGVLLFAIDQNPLMQGYLPVWLLTLLASTQQRLQNTFIETGPAFVERAPSEKLQQCWKNLFEACPRPDNHDKNQLTQVRPFGLILGGIAMCGSVVFLAWTWYYRKNMVVIKSQPHFLAMLCVGTLIMSCSIIPWSIDDSIAEQPTLNRACMATPWLFVIGFTTAFSALFSKIRRIYLVMKSAERFKRLVVKPIDVLPPFGILLTLNVILLLVWTIIDPMYFSRTEPIAKGDGLSSMANCHIGHGKVSEAMFASLVAVSLLVVVHANIQSYKARSIATEFSESKYVAMIMVGVLQLIILGAPLLPLVANTNPVILYFVVSFIIFSLCVLLLLGIFVPKILYMNEEEALKQHRLNNPQSTGFHEQTETIQPNCRQSVNPSRVNTSSVDSERGCALRVLDKYSVSEDQIPELAERLGCDASDLKSLLKELCVRT